MALSRHIGFVGRWIARAVLTLAFWTSWLVLSILLAAQAYIACSNQLEMPPFVIHALERRLAAAGMHATFGRTRFDPSGRVLIEDVRVTLPGFDEPLVTARAVYARLDPWALSLQRFEPLEIRLTDASLRVPAMFSPTGQADDLISGLDAVLLPRGAELDVASLNFRLGEMSVSAHGLVHLSGLQAGQKVKIPLTQFIAQNYGPASRQFAGLVAQLGILEHPVLELAFEPSETHAAVVSANLRATGMHLAAPVEVEAANVRLQSIFPLLSTTAAPIELAVQAGAVRLPGSALEIRGLQARVRAERPVGRAPGPGDIKLVELSAAELRVRDLVMSVPAMTLGPAAWPKLHLELLGRPFDAPLAVQADLDLAAQTVAVQADGQLAPAAIAAIGRQVHVDLKKCADFSTPLSFAGAATFGPGWRFQRGGGRFATRRLDTWQHLMIDAVQGQIDFDGRRMVASNVYARFGENFARGSYAMDVSTLRYRFLLEGRLQPLAITPWFPGQPWWPNLFKNFGFPTLPPRANIDWQGQWPTDHETRLFLAVEAPQVVINGAAYDHLFTRLWVRPSFDDGLEVSLSQGPGSASGTFARWYDKEADVMRRLDLDLSSTLATDPIIKVWPAGVDTLGAFAFDRPPTVKLTGRFDTPPAPAPARKQIHIEGTAGAPFRYHGFPFDRAGFTAEVKDDSFVLEPLTVGFANGTVTGRVEVQNLQKIIINAALKGGNLGRAIDIVQAYSSDGAPVPAAPTGDFMRNLANVQLDLALSATGAYGSLLTYHGRGLAEVQGPELTKVPMLGPLTLLLPFTELRFTNAHADFLVNGTQLEFPQVRIVGAHSRIDANGTYALDQHALDFNAIVYPLRESKSLPGQFFSVALSALSQLTRVRLTGSLDKPKWVLAASPLNLLRSRSPSAAGAAPSPLARPPAPLPSNPADPELPGL